MLGEFNSSWMAMAVLLASSLGHNRCCAMGPKVGLGIDLGSGAQYLVLLLLGYSVNYLILFNKSLFYFY